MNKTITILGSTGSIGTQSLEVCENMGYKVLGLTANSNIELLEVQARKYRPLYVAVADLDLAKTLEIKLKDTSVKVLSGTNGICEIAAMPCDVLINAIVGMAGLVPTLTAISAGNNIALANKETLVAAGKLVMTSAMDMNVKILPVDSEHSAIFQCMQDGVNRPSKLILTASGGPFFGKTYEELESVTVKDALNHPNWSMGSKITIDSATLMNKGLEFIEAMWLFDVQPKNIEIVVHRESILHSAVEYKDGSIIGQLGVPDMKIPIQYALTYPERFDCEVKRLSLTEIGTMSFYKPDLDTFTCLSTAIKAAKMGGLYPCAVNSANEEAVKYFLMGKIGFNHIGKAVSNIIDMPYLSSSGYFLDDVLQLDIEARIKTREFLGIDL